MCKKYLDLIHHSVHESSQLLWLFIWNQPNIIHCLLLILVASW